MPELEEVKRLANIVSRKLKSDATRSFVEITRGVIREKNIPRDERAEYLPAIGAELSARKHVSEARNLPLAPPREPQKPRVETSDQLGFGFGEGPRMKKNRPPTRRML